jgi:hypothetical protein
MALLRRGDLSVTEVCFTVGCSSLGTSAVASPDWSVCPQHLPAPCGARDGGDAVEISHPVRLVPPVSHQARFRIIRWHPLNRETAALTWAADKETRPSSRAASRTPSFRR